MKNIRQSNKKSRNFKIRNTKSLIESLKVPSKFIFLTILLLIFNIPGLITFFVFNFIYYLYINNANTHTVSQINSVIAECGNKMYYQLQDRVTNKHREIKSRWKSIITTYIILFIFAFILWIIIVIIIIIVFLFIIKKYH